MIETKHACIACHKPVPAAGVWYCRDCTKSPLLVPREGRDFVSLRWV